MNSIALRPAETEASPYAGYQLAYEVKKLMYDKMFVEFFSFCCCWVVTCYVVFILLPIFVSKVIISVAMFVESWFHGSHFNFRSAKFSFVNNLYFYSCLSICWISFQWSVLIFDMSLLKANGAWWRLRSSKSKRCYAASWHRRRSIKRLWLWKDRNEVRFDGNVPLESGTEPRRLYPGSQSGGYDCP